MEFRCQYHPDIVLSDKFSTCNKCARDFFVKHGITSSLYDTGQSTLVSMDDIIHDMDEILLKE